MASAGVRRTLGRSGWNGRYGPKRRSPSASQIKTCVSSTWVTSRQTNRPALSSCSWQQPQQVVLDQGTPKNAAPAA